MIHKRSLLRRVVRKITGIKSGKSKTPPPSTPGDIDLHPAEIPIQLDLNENPYGPPRSARIAMAENIIRSNRYNWQVIPLLISSLAKKERVKPRNILLGAGATEIIDLVLRHIKKNRKSIVAAEPAYDEWAQTADFLGFNKISVPVTKEKGLDLDRMLKSIEPDTELIYICNPNNPTGTICDRDSIVSFLNEATKKALVLVDEAYIDFTTQQSLSGLAAESGNIIVVKTFSKIYGFSGGRVGYAVANESAIEGLGQLRSWPPATISVASAAGALASLKDTEFLTTTRALNEKAKKFTIDQLERLNIACVPSHANFVYFSLARYKKDFFRQLKNNGIIGTGIYEEKGKWSRISVGTIKEMEMLIAALE